VKIAFLFFLLITHWCGASASWAARHTTVCLDYFTIITHSRSRILVGMFLGVPLQFCPANLPSVLGVVGKGITSSPEKKLKKKNKYGYGYISTTLFIVGHASSACYLAFCCESSCNYSFQMETA